MLHPETPLSTPSSSVTVVIPARNEEPTVGSIVASALGLSCVLEVIVVDDGSSDATARVAATSGARVLTATRGPGKGAAMRDGVAAARGDVIVFCDADLEDFDAAFIEGLAAALIRGGDEVALVKADYDRGDAGGRVTELTAKPVLELLHPAIAHVAQPLGGEYAAWRRVLEQLPFVTGYGVELGLLIDVARSRGAAAIEEVHLGVRRHRNRPLRELGGQAREVLAVALHRAGVGGVSVEELPPLVTPARRSA